MAESSTARPRRGVRGSGEATAAQIYAEGVNLIYESGYHAATLRRIADRVGMLAPSIYNHFASKDELLFTIVARTMSDLIDGSRRATADAAAPADRLAGFVRHLVTFHGERRLEAGVTDSEFRQLSPDRCRQAVELRDAYAAMLREIIDAGLAEGAFAVGDAALTCYAILTMGTYVSVWYRPDGRLPLAAIADQYVELGLRMVRAGDAAVTPRP